jgi:hypothetical protein
MLKLLWKIRDCKSALHWNFVISITYELLQVAFVPSLEFLINMSPSRASGPFYRPTSFNHLPSLFETFSFPTFTTIGTTSVEAGLS